MFYFFNFFFYFTRLKTLYSYGWRANWTDVNSLWDWNLRFFNTLIWKWINWPPNCCVLRWNSHVFSVASANIFRSRPTDVGSISSGPNPRLLYSRLLPPLSPPSRLAFRHLPIVTWLLYRHDDRTYASHSSRSPGFTYSTPKKKKKKIDKTPSQSYNTEF